MSFRKLAVPLCGGLALLSLAILGSGAARAQTYSVGVESNQYLPAYAYTDGEYRGFARALLDAFATDKGYRFDYRPMPVIRLFAALVGGDIDLKFPDNAMWSADLKASQNVVYSDPVMAYIDGVNVLPDRKGRSADTIRTMGLVRGFTAWDWQDRIKAGTVALHESNSFTALLETTILARNDGAYANVAVVHHQLETVLNKPGALVFDPSLPHTRSHYHLSSIKHPQLVAEFNGWMAANAARIARLKAEFAVEKGIN